MSVTEQNQLLIDTLVKQQNASMKLMEKLLEHVTITASAQREWLQLFKPQQQSTPGAASFDAREELEHPLAKKADEWTELDAHKMLNELGLMSTADEDGIM
jgi:hypothetical protein